MAEAPENPAGPLAAAAFFAGAGVLDAALGLFELPVPAALWDVSGLLGRASLYFVVAAILWRRLAVGRSIAMVYCLAALVTYGVALGLAWAHAPVHISRSLVYQSLYEVPSCVLLLPWLRSARAAELFSRPLLGHRRG